MNTFLHFHWKCVHKDYQAWYNMLEVQGLIGVFLLVLYSGKGSTCGVLWPSLSLCTGNPVMLSELVQVWQQYLLRNTVVRPLSFSIYAHSGLWIKGFTTYESVFFMCVFQICMDFIKIAAWTPSWFYYSRPSYSLLSSFWFSRHSYVSNKEHWMGIL